MYNKRDLGFYAIYISKSSINIAKHYLYVLSYLKKF